MEVIVIDRGGPPRRVALRGEDPITVGRAPSQSVVLGDPRVSRQHVVLEPYQGAWFVRDAGSANGTFVNAVKLRSAVCLRPGDVIKLGDSRAHVVETGDEASNASSSDDTNTASSVELSEALAGASAALAQRRHALFSKVTAATDGADPAVAAVRLAAIVAEAFIAEQVAFFVLTPGDGLRAVVSAPEADSWRPLSALAERAARRSVAVMRSRPILMAQSADARDTSQEIVRYDAFTLAVPVGVVVLALDGMRPAPVEQRDEMALLFALGMALAGTVLQAAQALPHPGEPGERTEQTLVAPPPLAATLRKPRKPPPSTEAP